MKSVAKKAKKGEVPSNRAKTRPGMKLFVRRFKVKMPRTSPRTANTRGVLRRRVPSSDAVSLCPAAFWMAAAA